MRISTTGLYLVVALSHIRTHFVVAHLPATNNISHAKRNLQRLAARNPLDIAGICKLFSLYFFERMGHKLYY